MPPPTASFSALKSSLAKSSLFSSAVEQRVEAGEDVELVLRQFLDEARDVARIGDQHVLAADAHADIIAQTVSAKM